MRFRMKTVLGAAAAGAAAMWLYDPDQGTRRRHQLGDQLRARVNKGERAVERKVHYEQNKLEGLVRRVNHRSSGPPADDRALVDKIKSEVIGQARYSPYDILVEANDGVVVLRGQISDADDRQALEAQVKAVPGVQRLESLLHAEGEDAPNKAAAIHAS